MLPMSEMQGGYKGIDTEFERESDESRCADPRTPETRSGGSAVESRGC